MAAFTEISLMHINMGNDPGLRWLDLKGFTDEKLSSLGREDAERLVERMQTLGLLKSVGISLLAFDLIRLMGESSQVFPLSIEGTVPKCLLWCQKSYGPKIGLIEKGWSEWVYRGYAQVKILQIPQAVTNILTVAKERERAGKSTYFKYLLASFDERRLNGGHYLDYIGDYSGYKKAEPVIAIYGDSPGMIQEILEALSEMNEWGAIESEYIKDNDQRREGTTAFINSKGIEFRSLYYNKECGNAESLLDIYGNGWRAHVQGAPTILGGD